MIYAVSTISSCLVTGYAFFEIMEALYEKKYVGRKYVYVLSFVMYILLSCAVNFVKIPLVNTVFSMIILCVLSYFLYHTGEKNVIINSGIVIIYFAITDVLVTAVFSTVTLSSIYDTLSEPKFYLISGLANALVILCTNNILIQLILRCRISKISRALYTYMIFLLFFEIGILCYLIYNYSDVENNILLMLVGVGFIIMDSGIIYLFKIVSRNARLEQQAELLEQQREMTVKYYEGLQDRYEKSQKLLHDIKKHIRVLSNLKGYDESLKSEYANELLVSVENIQPQFRCTDPIVSVIIWDKIQICRKEDISFNINIQDIVFDFMDKMEVTMLFANLLDNAIEACRSTGIPKKQIMLRIHRFKDFIVIKMRNSILKGPVCKNGKLISTKPKHFGIGMLILEELANKYDGNLNYDYSDEYFETKIILSIAEKC